MDSSSMRAPCGHERSRLAVRLGRCTRDAVVLRWLPDKDDAFVQDLRRQLELPNN